VLGLIAGAIAKAIMPGKDPGGIIVTLILGVVGALLGGWIGSAVFGVGLGGFFNLSTWLLAIVGSLILLAIYRVIVGRKVRA
ncbi:GlsB/YeaQ/YmgE family stress response membrane protein, partial [Acuticoccus kandeliae]